MFSKDVNNYQPTPRTLQQAFGPYAKMCPRERRREAVSVALFVAAIVLATAAAFITAMLLFTGSWA